MKLGYAWTFVNEPHGETAGECDRIAVGALTNPYVPPHILREHG
jgi:hypothetical protein